MTGNVSSAGPCECNWFTHAVAEPGVPVEFDEELNEYHLVYTSTGGGQGRMQMYFCPFCGGTSPRSRRADLFAHLTDDEWNRLQLTVADVYNAFGQPERDSPAGAGIKRPEKGWAPPVAESFRTLVYEALSETTEVHVTVGADDRLHFSFVGKYIGPPLAQKTDGGEDSR